jgi:hypothetical protein
MNSIYAIHAISADLLGDQLGKFTTAIRPLHTSLPDALTKNTIIDAGRLINDVMPHADYLAEAADQVLDGQDPTDAMNRYATAANVQALVEAVRKRAKARQTEAVNAAADTIIQTLRTEVFEPAIGRLRELAELLGWGWDLDAAISSEDFARAAAIKEATGLAARLTQADKARRTLHPEAFDGPAAYTKEPHVFELAPLTGRGGLTWWMQLIEAGTTLHFPTLAEYHELHNSKAHKEHREAQAAKEAEDPWEPISLSYENKH